MAEQKTKQEVLDNIAGLNEVQSTLEEKINELGQRRASLEAQITSLKYQVDLERKEMLAKVEQERNKMLLDIKKLESDIRLRERQADDLIKSMAGQRAILDQQEADNIQLRNMARRFNEEKLYIERMRRDAESLLETAKQMKAEAENMYNAYKAELDSFMGRKDDLNAQEKYIQQRYNELEVKSKEVSAKIEYYENLKSYINEQVTVGGVK